MNRDLNRLTALKVTKIKKPGRYGDGGGLVLQVSQWGTKAWLFRYEREGRERQMGLGPLGTISLAEARARAAGARKLLLDGLDPIAERKEARAAASLHAARAVTFKDCAEKYVASHQAGWRNEKHRAQWKATLASYAYPVIGNLSVAGVDTMLVFKVIEPLWTKKPETASRLRGRIESVLDWAAVRGLRSGDNPARWRGHLEKLLPSKSSVRVIKRHPAIPYAEMPEFMAALRQHDGISARVLEWTILTAVRTGEALGARWSEINLETRTWTIPAERMKAKKEHRVPLASRAIEILQELPRENDFIFVRAGKSKPLSNMAMLELMRGIKPGYVPHGCRSTFRDWAAETTNYPNHVLEMALAHAVGNRVEAAYRRGDLFEKRRCLMSDWARYCDARLNCQSHHIFHLHKR